MASINTTRRLNLLTLFRSFAEARLAKGEDLKGIDALFAEHLTVSPATLSMAKSGSRPIGDRLARQIEQRLAIQGGWLDVEREPVGITVAEQEFLDLALQAWRATNSAGRKRLREAVSKPASMG